MSAMDEFKIRGVVRALSNQYEWRYSTKEQCFYLTDTETGRPVGSIRTSREGMSWVAAGAAGGYADGIVHRAKAQALVERWVL